MSLTSSVPSEMSVLVDIDSRSESSVCIVEDFRENRKNVKLSSFDTENENLIDLASPFTDQLSMLNVDEVLVPSRVLTKEPSLLDCSKSLPTRNRWYWKVRKELKKNVIESIISDNNDDRPYANVEINGHMFRGLLDSGASISVLGVGCEKFLNSDKVKFRNFPCTLKTANGEAVRILGHIRVLVKFNDRKRLVTLHLAPGLKQELYLGIDFWDTFNIKPTIVGELSLNSGVENSDSEQHSLSVEQEAIVLKLRNTFPSFEKNGLGKTSLISHKIEVGSGRPAKQRYYPVSPAIQADLDKEINRMLRLGVIEVCQGSEWNSPVTLVKKANGKVRLCLDARKLNEATVKDSYPLPIIEGLLSRLDTTKFISSIDLKDAFWQIPLDECSRDKTAFTVPGRPLYQFTVLPFGLCNSPQTMCRLMHRVIPHELHDRVFVYLDDLLITSATFQEHVELLGKVSEYLRLAGLTINVEKSKFLLKQIKYLGYIVGDGCLKVDPDKVQAIENFPKPKTVRQIRRFLGMTGWFRRFVANYSTITAPLTELLKKGCKRTWSEKANFAFEQMKMALTTAPILVNADFKRRFFIQCDASTTGIGSVLFQISDDGNEHPIAFMSKKLNSAQKNYSITELECLSVVESIKKFRPYVEGYLFTVITDHASLKWLMGQKDLSGRLARWSLKLQGYQFEIEHRKGVQNIVPDTLSRMFENEEIIVKIEALSTDLLHIDLDADEFNDPEYVELFNTLRNNPESITNLREEKGKLLISPSFGYNYQNTDLPEWKLFVPKGLTMKLVAEAHDPPSSAHLGVQKTLNRLQRTYYWPNMARDVKKYVTACEICKTTKPLNYATKPPMGKFRESTRPFQNIFIDFLGPYTASKSGFTGLFIVVDQYSRFVLLEPMRRLTSGNVIKYLKKNIFNKFSVPENIWCDNGKQFISNSFKEFLNFHGVQLKLSPKYSPQGNISERVNRSIISAIRAYIKSDHTEWDVNIDDIASALRNAVHGSTKFSPHYLVFGTHKVLHGKDYELLRLLHGDNEVAVKDVSNRLNITQEFVLKNLKEAYNRTARNYNLRSCQRKFDVGQDVLVRNFVASDAGKRFVAKFAHKFKRGTILKAVGTVAFEVGDEKGKSMGVYHIKDIIA